MHILYCEDYAINNHESITTMVTKAVKERFNKNSFEYTAWNNNDLICGIDEVGRGCLAGPVVVSAVALFPHKIHAQIKDSKLMTHEEREKAYCWIKKNSWNSIALVHHRAIDSNNIYYATLMAMKRAFLQLITQMPKIPTTALVDAMPLTVDDTAYSNVTMLYFPFGERKSTSIAAASIVAKITRDRLMANHFEKVFPGYGFIHHKGYATTNHKESVRSQGRSIIHRVNFLSRTLVREQQHTIFEVCDE